MHLKLFECNNLEECSEVAKGIIDNFIENRMIYDELNYYKNNKQLLGKHPIFREFQRRKELINLGIKELMIRKSRLENNIWRVQSEINKKNKPHLETERTQKLEAYKRELEEINRLLE